jgi:hypothetical protein
MKEYSDCPKCDRPYRSDVFDSCPACLETGHPTAAKSSKVSQVSEDSNLIKAVDRTTYAIRSIALFIFISLCSSVIGYAIVGMGAGNSVSCAVSGRDCSNVGLVTFGWIVTLAGFIAAVRVGLSELSKSNP